MGFIKVTKNRAFFKRYQVKYRRRREGKTDYHARRALVTQDKDKYGARKYRLVVRFTNKRIICQCVYSTITGDRVLAAAESGELSQYGISVGLTNYAASYATGLLLARRLLKQVGLDETFTGVELGKDDDSGSEDSDERRPFRCILDLGLVRSTTGNRVFAVMKGAVDGGLDIPHSSKKFPGYDKESDSCDPAVHRARILGNHIRDYMLLMAEESPDKYDAHFSQFIKAGIEPSALEGMYEEAHKKIREDPMRASKPAKPEPVCVREGAFIRTTKAKYPRPHRFNKAQRSERVQRKIQLVMEKKQQDV